MKIDETDKKILNVIIENSKLSYRDIAKKVGVSVVTILKRVKELQKEEIIKAYTTEVDYEKLGYDFTVVIKMKVSQGKALEVGKKMANDPHVSAMYNILGDFDSVIIAKFKNRKTMNSFLKKIQTYEFVERTETNLVLNTIKEKNILVS